MNWGWPQFVYAGLIVFSLGVEIKTGKHSFTISLVSVALAMWLLYMGGFWTPAP